MAAAAVIGGGSRRATNLHRDSAECKELWQIFRKFCNSWYIDLKGVAPCRRLSGGDDAQHKGHKELSDWLVKHTDLNGTSPRLFKWGQVKDQWLAFKLQKWGALGPHARVAAGVACNSIDQRLLKGGGVEAVAKLALTMLRARSTTRAMGVVAIHCIDTEQVHLEGHVEWWVRCHLLRILKRDHVRSAQAMSASAAQFERTRHFRQRDEVVAIFQGQTAADRARTEPHQPVEGAFAPTLPLLLAPADALQALARCKVAFMGAPRGVAACTASFNTFSDDLLECAHLALRDVLRPQPVSAFPPTFKKPDLSSDSMLCATVYRLSGWVLLKMYLKVCDRKGRRAVIPGETWHRFITAFFVANTLPDEEADNLNLPTARIVPRGKGGKATNNASLAFYNFMCRVEQCVERSLAMSTNFGAGALDRVFKSLDQDTISIAMLKACVRRVQYHFDGCDGAIADVASFLQADTLARLLRELLIPYRNLRANEFPKQVMGLLVCTGGKNISFRDGVKCGQGKAKNTEWGSESKKRRTEIRAVPTEDNPWELSPEEVDDMVASLFEDDAIQIQDEEHKLVCLATDFTYAHDISTNKIKNTYSVFNLTVPRAGFWQVGVCASVGRARGVPRGWGQEK